MTSRPCWYHKVLRAVSWLFPRLALMALSVGLALALGEVAVRILAPQRLEPNPRGLYVPDPQLGYRLAGGFRGRSVTREWNVPVSTNALGLRSRAITPKRPGEYRILFLGDSFTFGEGVGADDTYVALVERELNRDGFAGVTTVNAGVLGYGTLQETALLDRLEPVVRPDAVVLAFFENDFNDNIGGQVLEVLDGYLVGAVVKEDSRLQLLQRLGMSPRAKLWLRTRSHLYTLAMNAWARALFRTGANDADVYFDIYREPLTARMGRAVAVTKRALDRYAGHCRQWNQRCGVVFFPDPRLSRERASALALDRGVPGKILGGLVQQAGLAWLDLTTAFDSTQNLYYPLDGHWKTSGHLAAASALVESMERGAFPIIAPASTAEAGTKPLKRRTASGGGRSVASRRRPTTFPLDHGRK